MNWKPDLITLDDLIELRYTILLSLEENRTLQSLADKHWITYLEKSCIDQEIRLKEALELITQAISGI